VASHLAYDRTATSTPHAGLRALYFQMLMLLPLLHRSGIASRH